MVLDTIKCFGVPDWQTCECVPVQVASMLLTLLMLVAIVVAPAETCADESDVQTGSDTLPQADSNLPVILVTGFEPFGPGRPPNPSWEGIKDLNGKAWKGYRLVCKELPVVWGAPLQQLSAWIEEYKPVAIFSFGQGGASAFTFETRSRNKRGRGRDNNGERPAEPVIVADGEAEYRSSLNSEQYVNFLKKQDFRVSISENAGAYLCEEALHSLEHLKRTVQNDMAVAFCHVPPLGVTHDDVKITAAYVQQFVLTLLDAWRADARHKEGKPVVAATEVETGTETETKTEDRRTAEVRKRIVYYFESWSNQNMKGYADCFYPEAVIQLIEKNGTIQNWAKPQFIESQSLFHQNSREKVTEAPATIDIRFEQDLARVVVFWKLKSPSRRDEGYDHFTLAKQNGQWRIVNLVFYSTR